MEKRIAPIFTDGVMLKNESTHIWLALSETTKTKLLLGSLRILDEEIFLREFGSLEQPEITDDDFRKINDDK